MAEQRYLYRPAGPKQSTLLEKLRLLCAILLLPGNLIWALVTSSFTRAYKHQSWRRIFRDVLTRSLMGGASIGLVQALLGTDEDVYLAECKTWGVEAVIDEFSSEDRDGDVPNLLWIGNRDAEKVVFYLHGGGFVFPVSPGHLSTLRYLHLSLLEKGIDNGIAILQYSLIPYKNADFPTPLHQAVLSLGSLLQSRAPENIHLAGDSAGGNLVLQLLSHALHPIPSLPPFPISSDSSLGSALLISPWVTLRATGGSFAQNDGTDNRPWRLYENCGRVVLEGVPSGSTDVMPYIQPYDAPPGWFSGTVGVVRKVLVTNGSLECLRDHIHVFYHTHFQDAEGARYYLEENGKHIDPILQLKPGKVDVKRGRQEEGPGLGEVRRFLEGVMV